MDCHGCGARHHPGCFAEHGRCSTFGCEAQNAERDAGPGDDLRAQVAVGFAHGRHGSNAEGFAWLGRGLSEQLECSHCQATCADAPLLAHCACNAVMHVDCYEAVGACRSPACALAPLGPLRIVSPGDAIRRRRWNVGSSLRNLGMIFGVPLLVCWALVALGGATAVTLVMVSVMSALCAFSFTYGTWLRRPLRAPEGSTAHAGSPEGDTTHEPGEAAGKSPARRSNLKA